MTTLAALITSCRILAGDGVADNFMRGENLNSAENGNVIDGSNRVFSVANFPVVPGGFISIRSDNLTVTPASVNEPTGTITLAVAPTTSLYATYFYYQFSDAIWTEFVVAALQNAAVSSGTPSLDVLNVPESLLHVIKAFANYYFAMRISEQTGLWYNQRLQERVEDRDGISKKWLSIADAKLKAATAMLAAYFAGQGAQLQPSFRIGGWQPMPYTPDH